MIAFACPHCDRKLSVKDEFAGRIGNCPHCKQRLQVPAGAAGAFGRTHTEAPGDQAEDPTLPPTAYGPPPQAAGERLDFLAPPQGPGELGRLGSYRVLKVLGAGGMGMVLQAEDPVLKRIVALKVMRPELAAQADARERFLREAQATAAIEHPHIVHLYQVGEDRGVPYLAMPFLKGEPLDERLKRQKKLPAAEVIHLGRQIAEGLAAAHEHGLIHRDIKPANLWLEPTEQGGSWVKILDFGLARAVKGDDGQLTKSGAIMGTPAYMAPEQARGQKVDGRCDLFSLGGVLYRMLTGELPFKGDDTISLLMALATEAPRPVTDFVADAPPPLVDLIQRLLSKEPEQRPASARTVADALAEMETERTQRLPAATAAAPPGARETVRPTREEGEAPEASPRRGGRPAGRPTGCRRDRFYPTVRRRETGPCPHGGCVSLGFGQGNDQQHRHEADADRARHVLDGFPQVRGGPQRRRTPARGRSHQTLLHRRVRGHRRSVCGVRQGNRLSDRRREDRGRELYADVRRGMEDGRESNVENPRLRANRRPSGCLRELVRRGGLHPLADRERMQVVRPALGGAVGVLLPRRARTKFSFGDDPAKAAEYAWTTDNAAGASHPVGQKKPNAWGLFDMHGNAGEWCHDWYDKDYYRNGPREDPIGPRAGRTRVTRGGGWRTPIMRKPPPQ